jgi:dimeric dUTPase (all-alpha-NTP-PPase superfamily)
MGMLQKMLNMQNNLQEKLGYNIKEMSMKERVDFIKEFSIHATQELHEMLYELPYLKPWKDYNEMTYGERLKQFEKARQEFSDFMHFTLNIALALGFFEEQDLYKYYVDKNKENHVRQDEGRNKGIRYKEVK